MRVSRVNEEKQNRIRIAEAKVRIAEAELELEKAKLDLLSFKENENKENYPLHEFTSEQFYEVLLNEILKRKLSTKERVEIISNQFKNILRYEKEFDRESNSHVRVKTPRTHLQLKNGAYCTKKEFKDEFLKYEFNNQSEANTCLELLLKRFDNDGWLIIEQ